MFIKISAMIFIVWFVCQLSAQENKNGAPQEADTVASIKNAKFEALPIISYDTDVGFGYGAKLFFLNHIKQNESFDITLFNSTKGERWYRLVFSLPDYELRQGKIYSWALDLVVDYDKWINNSFFGIGNNSRYENREFYTKEPFEISLTLSKGVSSCFVGQAGVRYKSTRNFHLSDNGRLINLSPILNLATVRYVSIFAGWRYDTRNSFINPSEGLVLQGELEFAPKSELSNVTFVKFVGWAQYYTTLIFPKTVLALRFGIQNIWRGNLPIQVLLPIGGNSTLRGYSEDRYLDKAASVINAEIRFPIIWRFGGLIGFDTGKVWNSIMNFDLSKWAVNPTIGLRFFMDTFIVRVDLGFGKKTTGVYFNFGHLF